MQPPRTYRAPPGALLDEIGIALQYDAATGIERTTIDIHLIIALLRYAMNVGAVCVGDLTDAC